MRLPTTNKVSSQSPSSSSSVAASPTAPTLDEVTPTLLITSPTEIENSMDNSPLSPRSTIPFSSIAAPMASGSTSPNVSGSNHDQSVNYQVSSDPLPSDRFSNGTPGLVQNQACAACVVERPYVNKIRSPSHIILAFRLLLIDPTKRRQLFTNWVHVPVGITALLFLVWCIKQAMDRAPFRFPSPVLAMVLLFIILLSLDYLSTTSFIKSKLHKDKKNAEDIEAKALLQPMLTLLEAPCDFCLRYMSVMFTPSFILIPARELINGKEIGIITGWFAASQILALIFPILLHKLICWFVATTKRQYHARRNRKQEKVKKVEEQRRASVATLVAIMSNINGVPSSTSDPKQIGSASASGEEMMQKGKEKKELFEGEKLGSIATGVSGMTAIATAPLTVSTTTIPPTIPTGLRRQASSSQRQDAQRQWQQVQFETARQQGDPYALTHTPVAEHHHHYPLKPYSPGSPRPTGGLGLHHNHRFNAQEPASGSGASSSSYFMRTYQNEAVEERSRSLARNFAARAKARVGSSLSPLRFSRPHSAGNGGAAMQGFGSVATDSANNKKVVGGASRLKHLASSAKRPQSAGSQPASGECPIGETSLSPAFNEYIFQTRQVLLDCRGSASPCNHIMQQQKLSSEGEDVAPHRRDSEEGEEEQVAGETLVMPTMVSPTPMRASHDDVHGDCIKLVPGCDLSTDGVRRSSKADSEKTMSHDIEAQALSTADDFDAKKSTSKEDTGATDAVVSDEDEMDAIDILVENMWNSIPWVVFTMILIAGIPVFYLLDVSLPLFLSINLMTFLFAITVIPPQIRRYAHPILTTSVATVFLLWGVGAIRGWSLKRTLNSYSVDAKYTVLWSLSGYDGPVIGAGDVLFSTLDAGIVSLAIPMYRYRWDLWFHLVDMLMVLFPCSLLSLFVWPTVAANIGIAPERALAFASRFMSTPLAIELSLTIGADESITVVLVVITGILISIFKDPFFRLFGLNPDLDGPPNNDNTSAENNGDQLKSTTDSKAQDYLTIGIVMGSTAGAIGASSLISKPRSMAIASLSFVLFGAILLVFAAIPVIVDTLRSLVNAPIEFIPAT
ncbi:uncharacterized protein MEPE_05136 [Melanopsichium pennsylvanicum]|uniref:LrgB-domain-containing protein n=2 Tax=Melanopsichium pennsylvanicum TaxID=63383 RepID=A0AAJ4XR92_9BASI|nr:conserved hypothetical protein [Melanopsichium pennsylvanicum 4]SNX86427.1 uncharacterized protein MEPE_05136 [Melanopsichium pennsylvanicum]